MKLTEIIKSFLKAGIITGIIYVLSTVLENYLYARGFSHWLTNIINLIGFFPLKWVMTGAWGVYRVWK